MQTDVFLLLSLILVLAVGISLLMRFLRQPLIVGYIVTGIIVGPSLLNLIPSGATFSSFSSIGIALLLFIIGLGLNASVIRRLGKVVVYTALAEIGCCTLLGYGVSLLLGYSMLTALIIGFSLALSSTIIVIKILNDKREQSRLFAQITIGVSLIQDIVASIALVFVSASSSGSVAVSTVGWLVLSGFLLAVLLAVLGLVVLPRFSRFFASSQEFLFLFALAWGFGIATLFQFAGFSIEVGALFAGVSLAGLPYAQEVASRLKPLRDFFIVIFFVALGEKLHLNTLAPVFVPALVLSVFVVLIKPLTVLATLGWLGYTKRTSFKTSLTQSQLSEFAIVLTLVAVSYHLVNSQVGVVLTLVAMVTIAISAYLMQYDDKLFIMLERRLQLFERRVTEKEHRELEAYPLVLLGYKKGGEQFVKSFRALKRRYVVVDYDPEVIEDLELHRINHVYGDVSDLELLKEIGLAKSRLIVSTITDHETNINLVRHIMSVNANAIIVCQAEGYRQAVELYHLGATYVMMPHLIGSEKISSFIKRAGLHKREFVHYREQHLILLEKAI